MQILIEACISIKNAFVAKRHLYSSAREAFGEIHETATGQKTHKRRGEDNHVNFSDCPHPPKNLPHPLRLVLLSLVAAFFFVIVISGLLHVIFLLYFPD